MEFVKVLLQVPREELERALGKIPTLPEIREADVEAGGWARSPAMLSEDQRIRLRSVFLELLEQLYPGGAQKRLQGNAWMDWTRSISSEIVNTYFDAQRAWSQSQGDTR